MQEDVKPEKEFRSVCPYCGVGCGLLLGTRGGKVVSVRGDPDNIVSEGKLCAKGRFGTREFINHSERLTKPLVRKGSELKESTWAEALSLVAEKLAEHKGKFAALASAKATNEENYVFQKFVRAAMGTNNVDHCARL